MKKFRYSLLTILAVTFCLVGCAGDTTSIQEKESRAEALTGIAFDTATGWYGESLSVAIQAESTVEEIRYTLDGSLPDEKASLYEEAIELEAGSYDFPKDYCLRAVGYYEDGTATAVISAEYLIGRNIEDRFTTPVFCLWGDPSDLTEKDSGILVGENAEIRGKESEKEIYAVAFDTEGKELFCQNAGVRVQGKASRNWSVKSLKLYARKDYDEDNKTFEVGNIIGAVDSEGEPVTSYKRLVLRDGGNDFLFAFIRDEFSQTLAAQAGLKDYEASTPAVAYINGNYYGYYYLHENYCDTYFKTKYPYPDETFDGKFEIIEGTDAFKSGLDTEDGEAVDAAAYDYQTAYDEFIAQDLTDDSVYEKLTEFMDVENYLDYFAVNIFVNNWDWPQNNYRCYRYYAEEGTDYGEDVYDGRWRFLPHDMDYSMGLYGQDKVMANYDNLKHILKEGDDRYAPLFAKLMEREDCREYFTGRLNTWMETIFSTDELLATFEELLAEHDPEMVYYYEYLEGLAAKGDDSIWSVYSYLADEEEKIRDFLKNRPAYVAKMLENNFAEE